MQYTIHQLSKIFGITVRTLRHYDQIGLLRPPIRMENGRAYYLSQDLFNLVQILTLKNFGFGLSKIKAILKESPKYQLAALRAQRATLQKEQKRLDNNLQLLDLIIQNKNQENTKMDQPISEYFKNKECAKYFEETYTAEKRQEMLDQFKVAVGGEYFDVYLDKVQQLDTATAQIYGMKSGQFFGQIMTAMAQDQAVDSPEVQQLVANQWETLQQLYPSTNSKHIYLAIRDQLCNNPFTRDLDKTPDARRIMDYISQAMEVFADTHLTEE